MKFIFASDSFKGSLSSERIISLLSLALKKCMPSAESIGLWIADGGEGTTDAVVYSLKGEKRKVRVHDPLGREILAEYGILDADTAILEMASASGLPLLKEEERDPLLTSTYGTGELIREVLQQGYRKVFIAIGGSATNDGGVGALRALGVRFYDRNHRELPCRGMDLKEIAVIDDSGLIKEIKDSEFVVLSDVTNPLCGPLGATYTFGRQKGADDARLQMLEDGMCHYRDLLTEKYGINVDEIPGGGAAGGLGTALRVFLNAKMQRGIETLLDLLSFDELLKDADYVISGEGRTDAQSSYGKVLQGVGDRAYKQGVKVIDLCGCLADGYEEIYQHGVTKILTTMKEGMELSYAMEHAEELYLKAAEEMFEEIKNGRI